MTTDIEEEIRSDYLFARPSFFEGMGRLVDVAGSLDTYNTSRTGDEADAEALARDWRAVGRDLRAAFSQAREIAAGRTR